MALKQDIGMPCNICTSCNGFKIHGWRKFCVDCKCSVENHDISDESTLSILNEMKLFDKPFYSNYQDSLNLASKVNKSWLPIGLKFNEIDEFVSLLPNMCDKGTDERRRKRKLRLQIPITDRCVEKFCHLDHSHTTTERQEAEKFLHNRNNRDIGLGRVTRIADNNIVCADCHDTLSINSLSVTIDNHNPADSSKQFWHPSCFKCTICKQLLVDYIYANHNHRIFCIRHYSKSIRPRCGSCDELIFSGEYIRANDDEFHSNHFACSLCDGSLAKQPYVNINETQAQKTAVCRPCYDQKVANRCQKCAQPISSESRDVGHGGSHWHESCFNCVSCDCSLIDREFATTTSGQIFCVDCHRERNLPRCGGCGRPLEPGGEVVRKEGDDRSWHATCVICEECHTPLTASFVREEGRTLCLRCYDETVAPRCQKCSEPVRGGVSFQGGRFHQACFRCCHCDCGILGGKYVTKNRDFYCKGCYDGLFASKCVKCQLLISADVGLKYVKFEDRSWHSACFLCQKCGGSLVDKGFLTKDGCLFCTHCGV